MIVVTGDTHRDFRRLSSKNTKRLFEEGDFVIIAGDCGLTWDNDDTFRYYKDILENKPYTTLFIDGNHENFDILNSYNIEEWHGGKVHHIAKDKIIHLMRGQVYDIEGKKIFTFGGGHSHDMQGGLLDKKDPLFKQKVKEANKLWLPYRIIGESWWKEEMPSDKEYEEGLANLEANNWQVDYIITHCIASSYLSDIGIKLGIKGMEPDELTEYFENIKSKTAYNKWYCGHYHLNYRIDDKHTVLYESFEELR